MKKTKILELRYIRKDGEESNLYQYGTSLRLKNYNEGGLNLDMVAHPIKLYAIDLKTNQTVLEHEVFEHGFLCWLVGNGIDTLPMLIEVEITEGKINLHKETVPKNVHVTYIDELGDYKGVELNSYDKVHILNPTWNLLGEKIIKDCIITNEAEKNGVRIAMNKLEKLGYEVHRKK